MKSRSKFYLFAGFGVSVAALVIYLLVSSPNHQKPAATPARPIATAAPKSEPTASLASPAVTEKVVPTPTAPVPVFPSVASTSASSTPLPLQAPGNEEAPANENASSPADSVASNTSLPAESIATRRMYMAHASLRTPEVANPDSEANRRILQTMVTKALASAPTSSLPANHKN